MPGFLTGTKPQPRRSARSGPKMKPLASGHDDVGGPLELLEVRDEPVGNGRNQAGFAEDGCDVPEHDSLYGEVGDSADGLFDPAQYLVFHGICSYTRS